MNPLVLAVPSLFLTAFLFSMIGMGGGVIYVPLMLTLFEDYSWAEATTTSLLMASVTGIWAALNFSREGYVDMALGVLFAAASIVGILLGILFQLWVNTLWLMVLYVCILSAILFTKAKKSGGDDNERERRMDIHDPEKERKIRKKRMFGAAGALFVGFLSSSLGIGGGVIFVPLFSYLGLPTKKAIGTSFFTLSLITITGFSLLMTNALWAPNGRPVDVASGDILIMLGTVTVGSLAGSRYASRYGRSATLQKIYIAVLLLAGAKMVHQIITVLTGV